MEVRNSTFACFIELLTPNTYVMVVISDPSICKFQGMNELNYVVCFSIGGNINEYSKCSKSIRKIRKRCFA
jgi:hypothetical protein